MVDGLLVWLRDVPPFLLYAVLGVGAAVENLVPLIPADTFVLLGGFLAARGSASEGVVFLVTWTSNVLSALAVYTAAYLYGESFFNTRIGRYLLDPEAGRDRSEVLPALGSGSHFLHSVLTRAAGGYARFRGCHSTAPHIGGVPSFAGFGSLVRSPRLGRSVRWAECRPATEDANPSQLDVGQHRGGDCRAVGLVVVAISEASSEGLRPGGWARAA